MGEVAALFIDYKNVVAGDAELGDVGELDVPSDEGHLVDVGQKDGVGVVGEQAGAEREHFGELVLGAGQEVGLDVGQAERSDAVDERLKVERGDHFARRFTDSVGQPNALARSTGEEEIGNGGVETGAHGSVAKLFANLTNAMANEINNGRSIERRNKQQALGVVQLNDGRVGFHQEIGRKEKRAGFAHVAGIHAASFVCRIQNGEIRGMSLFSPLQRGDRRLVLADLGKHFVGPEFDHQQSGMGSHCDVLHSGGRR